MKKHRNLLATTLIFLIIPVGALAIENISLTNNLIPSQLAPTFLPIILKPEKHILHTNAPFFEGEVSFSETAIFWFGQVKPTENYADLRLGYNSNEIFIHIAAFDRRLWYDTQSRSTEITEWDAVSVFLNKSADPGINPVSDSYRFVGQLNWFEERTNWQAAFQGNGMGWGSAMIPFTTTSGWRGNAPNDDIDDRGWYLSFQIPFTSLGIAGPPPEGTTWGFAVSLHDRDDSAGTPISIKTLPEDMHPDRPNTWGQLHFGLPTYTPPIGSSSPVTTTIRHGLNGVVVVDAHVGGHTTCGQPFWPNFFNGWGEANYAGFDQINVQNQFDLADWPCFSKYFVTFPLESIPPGKVILSAQLKMFLFGNSGMGQQPPPQPSLIQVLSVEDEWDEGAITWNNAPYALENIGRTWVDPVESFPGWPGIPYQWDLSAAVAKAYYAGQPLRISLYSADGPIHSGKYFVSSDAEDWNAEGRPTLLVQWGEPLLDK